jgi:5'-3' exonuclease
MDVYLIDGTYELFRHFFAVPSALDVAGNEVGAVRGVLASILGLIESGATHVGVATDHVVESFRNDLYPGYKTSEGVPAPLMAQFPVLEEALESMGVKVWPMVRYEADDALASAAAKAASDERVGRVFICTPDKDLAQCVVGSRVVQFDRRRGITRDEAGVIAKWGVGPESIPDYLAVVGDSADGFPGLPGWGPKAAALVFAEYPHLEDVPKNWRECTTRPSGSNAQRCWFTIEKSATAWAMGTCTPCHVPSTACSKSWPMWLSAKLCVQALTTLRKLVKTALEELSAGRTLGRRKSRFFAASNVPPTPADLASSGSCIAWARNCMAGAWTVASATACCA